MLMDKSAKSAGSGAPGGQGSSQIPAGSAGGDTAVPGPQPNILFILVDELRFPKWVFPAGVTDADGLFQKTHAELLQADLDKGREVLQLLHRRQCLHAGPRHHHLRPLLATKLADDDDHSTPDPSPILLKQPVLNPAYPTYGKLLQKAGYQTPYRGKRHVSIPLGQHGWAG